MSRTSTKRYACHRCGRDDLRDWQVFETGWPKRIRYWCMGEHNHAPRLALLHVHIREWWLCKRGLM